MTLSEKEAQLFNLIKTNPYFSQQELAEKMNLSRSTVANMISRLIEEKYLLGRAYVVNEKDYLVCIGGANVDRKLQSLAPLQPATSNPATSALSIGGVARNIAENLGRLGHSISLLSVCGKDSDFEAIKQHSQSFMNLDAIYQTEEVATGSYTAVLDADGNMAVALADMSAYDLLTPEVIQLNLPLLHGARAIIIDLNCPAETLHFIIQFGKQYQIPVIVIPVSSPKMAHLPKDLAGVSLLIANRDESETFLDTQITDTQSWQNAMQKWLNLGVENIVITNGQQGAMAMSQTGEQAYQAAICVEKIIDVTGAGDAFSGAFIDSWLNGGTLADCLKFATTNAVFTIRCMHTVRTDLTKEKLIQNREELAL